MLFNLFKAESEWPLIFYYYCNKKKKKTSVHCFEKIFISNQHNDTDAK